jgi:hypothetical protein
LNACAGDNTTAGIAVAAHEPQMVSDGRRSVVGHNDDGIRFVEAGNLIDEFTNLGFHDKVESGERLVHQEKALAAQELLDNGDGDSLARTGRSPA